MYAFVCLLQTFLQVTFELDPGLILHAGALDSLRGHFEGLLSLERSPDLKETTNLKFVQSVVSLTRMTKVESGLYVYKNCIN